MDKRQMVEAFRQVYGGLGLPPEMETSLLGAWCMAWTAGAEAAREDADSLACVGSILSDEIDESRDLFLQEWASLVDQKGYWTESGTEWKRLPEYADLAAKSRDGLPCIVRLTKSGYLRGVSYPDGTYIAGGASFPSEKICRKWFIPDYAGIIDFPGISAAPEWIPIGERLPRDNMFVLIRDVGGACNVAYRESDAWVSPSSYKGGVVSTWDSSRISHWKPL